MINAQICSANAAFPVAKTTHHIEVAKDNLTKSCRWVGRLDRYIINESFKIPNNLFYGPTRQNNLVISDKHGTFFRDGTGQFPSSPQTPSQRK